MTLTKPGKPPPAKVAKSPRDKAYENALPQLQSIMAHAKSAFSQAERHHEKAVQNARSAVDDFFQKEAKALGAEVVRYASTLEEAAEDLSRVVNASKAELAVEEQAEVKNASASWGGPAMDERARAGAIANAAEREVSRLYRKKDQDVHKAVAQALAPLDDAASKLSRKVGDLSSVYDDAKASLDWAVKQGGIGGSMLAKLNITKDPKAVEKAIEAARNATVLKIKSAEQQFDRAVTEAISATGKKVSEIEDGIRVAEKDEIKRVRR